MILRLLSLAVSVALMPMAFCVSDSNVEIAEGLQPQLAVSPDGRVHVVFGRDTAVFYTNSADGVTFSPAVKVGELEKLALRMRRGPRVSATNDLVAVTAISHADGMLHLWVSSDHGKTWDVREPINTTPKSAAEGLHAMAGDGRGLLAVVWQDNREGGMQEWSRVSRDGGMMWGAEARVYASPDGAICPCCHPSVAIGPKGEITAMWRNAIGGMRDMWTATSRDGGESYGVATKLGTGSWKFDGCPMDGGGLIYNGETVATAWRREGKLFASKGGELGEALLVEKAIQPVVARYGRSVGYAWEQQGEIYLQIGDTKARRVDAGHAPALVTMGGGGVFLVWEGEGGRIRGMVVE